MNRSTLLTTLFSLCLLAPIGCSVGTSDESNEAVGATDDALTSAAQSLVGRYYDANVPFAGIARLALGADGKYTAEVEAGGRALCITSPCLLPESGTWNATKSANGTLRLRLKAQGEPNRFYSAKKAGAQLTITREGKTQILTVLDAGACFVDGDCSADQACAPKVITMACAYGDIFCGGPSTCQPKSSAPKFCGGFAQIPCGANEECVDDPTDDCDPTKADFDCGGICQPKSAPTNPPPSCAGAWLDQNGVCRTPADGVYPDACCAGPKCGDAQCGAGEVCCNPLAGICTPPGWACTQ